MDDDHHKDLAENHRRIWLSPLCEIDERAWCQDPQHCDECGSEAIEYIRADIVRSLVSDDALKAAIKDAK